MSKESNQPERIEEEMSHGKPGINYVEALKRPFMNTKKFVIGSVLGMIPIMNLAVLGYSMESTGLTEDNVKRNTLPEWKNYFDLFKKGLVAALIGGLLLLPSVALLLGTVGTVVMSPALSMICGGLPIETCDAIINGTITDLQMEDWITQNWTQFIPLIVNATPLLILGGLIAALAVYIMPAAILGWLSEGRIGAAFSWKNLGMTTTLDYLVNVLIVGYLGGLLGSLVGWIPWIGAGITMYVTGVFSYTVFSQIRERSLE